MSSFSDSQNIIYIEIYKYIHLNCYIDTKYNTILVI